MRSSEAGYISVYVDSAVFREWYETLAREYRAGLERGQAAGELVMNDPETTVYCAMGLADFVGMRFALWEGDVPDDAFDTVLGFLSRGLQLNPTSQS